MRGGPRLLQVGEPLPSASEADSEGLVAVGGSLEVPRVLAAYRRGIFPWPLLGASGEVLWFSPDPRFVVEPGAVHVGRSLRRLLGRRRFRVTCDQRFADVIGLCARVSRSGQAGTWITPALESTFRRLHHLGLAHSVEVWGRPPDSGPRGDAADADQLIGGLYGLALGRVFFGESMFSLESNASKIAFALLSRRLADSGFQLIDCQQETDHLARFGARSVPRDVFLKRLDRWIDEPSSTDPWSDRDWT